MSDRRFRADERTARLRPPADPWAEPTVTERLGISPTLIGLPVVPGKRQVYGRVYELVTGDPIDGPHPYVGQTTQTLHQRVHTSRNAHTSAASVAKDPWKARILPGRAGYRLLKVIYATGDARADQIALDMAEAFAIDELKTTHNTVRPVRPPLHLAQPVRPRPTKRKLTAVQRGTRRRMQAFAALFAATLLLVGTQLAAVEWTEPAIPWIATPVLAAVLTWLVYFSARNAVRRIKRKW